MLDRTGFYRGVVFRRGTRLGFCVLLACSIAGGCGSPDDPLGRQAISGKVTLNGAPLETGSIRFEPQGGAGATAGGAMIARGEYKIPANQGLAPGKYRVFITATEASEENRTPDEIMNNPGPPRKELIPPKYNRQSELTVEVTADGSNEFDFALEAK